ncbi:MAG: low molecular weight phosphotyrosine protein phosphatase [Deltaproteobacteria bacterium]|nr:low molecular weight phosphotyrosine protein phosphatase [Deltaproteobacteria bacterium]
MKIRVCFVCLGNICRSPQAEGVFLRELAARGLRDRFEVDSAGTGAYHVGERPDPRTLATSERHGVPLPSRARHFVAGDFERFDYVVAMDRSNAEHLRRLARNESERERISLLRSWDAAADGDEVPDPYYGGADGFENVFAICTAGARGLLDSLVAKHPELR